MLKKWWNKPITNGTIVKNWVGSIVAWVAAMGVVSLCAKSYAMGKEDSSKTETENVTEETEE